MGKASTYQRRARDFAQRADWDAALAELRQAAAADPGNPMLQNQMGDLFLRKEEVTQACQHFEKAIELYASLGLHNNAVALCRKVIRLCPSRLEVRYQLACLRHEQGLRSEATAFFLDYFDHLPVQGEAETRALEERSTEILESYPESAPVGKILEKLEDAGAFRCAFELVQRLAQRATDAGDDEAARRYTTKMRSLRVLVESHGGDLPEPAPPTQVDVGSAQDERREPQSVELPEEDQGEPESAGKAAQTWIEPTTALDSGSLEVPESLELETPEVPEVAALPEEQGSSVDHDVEQTAAIQSVEPETPPEIEMAEPVATAEPVDSSQAGNEEGVGKEYELPESSIEDVAALWADAAGVDAAAPETDSLEDTSVTIPELDLGSGTDFAADAEEDAAASEALAKEPEELPHMGEAQAERPCTEPPELVSLESFDSPVQPQGVAHAPESPALVDPSESPTDPDAERAADSQAAAEEQAPALEALDTEREEPPCIDDEQGESRSSDAELPELVESFDAATEPETAAPLPEWDGTLAAEQEGVFDTASSHPAQAVENTSPPQPTPDREVPASEAPAPTPPAQKFQEPVWVPEGDLEPGQFPSPEAGSMHELSDVIDTFRKQMAMALGDDASARYDLGVAYYEMGLYDEALSEFEAAQPSAALRERSLEMMAACMAMQGRHAEILDLLAPVLEGPAEAERALGLRYCMGVACEALGRRDEARQHFEQVARIDSDYRDVSSRLQIR